MTWFKVDDGLAFHPKAIAAGNAALGLWVRAGSWCGANLTDGWVPAHMVRTLGGQARDARNLVEAGLWIETSPNLKRTQNAHEAHTERTQNAHAPQSTVSDISETRVREKGYQFSDWEHYQPTKVQVEEERERTRERVSRWRAKHGNAVTNAVTNTVSNAVSNGAPSRPVPKSVVEVVSHPQVADAQGAVTMIRQRMNTTETAAASVARTIQERFQPRDLEKYLTRIPDDELRKLMPTTGNQPPKPHELCDHGRHRDFCPFCQRGEK